MPKFLVQGSYTSEGAKGLQKDGGTKRRQVAEALVKEAGGTLEAFYFTLGETDFALIANLPDISALVAVSLTVNASGLINLKSIPLITPEEMDAAAKRKLAYRPPGH
jgi:uncharacterized protein with GYD domain